ncbi:MAG: hypothetical protein Q7J47_05240 [Azoarcus sp.]|nr:hypothetical protein [Azoarcus sp.]
MLKRLIATLALALFLLLIGTAALMFSALESTALVSRPETISPDSVAQARKLFLRNDPRHLRPGEVRRVSIPANLIDDGLNHFASRLRGRAAFDISRGQAQITASFQLPYLRPPSFLNVHVSLAASPGELRLETATIGNVKLPPLLVRAVARVVLRLTGYADEWELVHNAIRTVEIAPRNQAVNVVYVWHPELLERARARALALTNGDVLHLERAQRALAALLTHRAQNIAIALPEILQPMLRLPSEDALQQRRASLLVMAAYMAGKGLTAVVPNADEWPRPAPRMLTLRDRHDIAQHFVVSAALAAWAGEPAANAIGLYKELDDSRRGSGFSFADLAANLAGTRFGKLLLDDPERIDAMLRDRIVDADLIPDLRGLPEYLSERDFARYYGSIDSPAYRNLVDEIERRMDAQPLYR